MTPRRKRMIDETSVTFTYRDRKDGDQVKRETLPAHEFIRRFLCHVVPWNFHRTRYYGLGALIVFGVPEGDFQNEIGDGGLGSPLDSG